MALTCGVVGVGEQQSLGLEALGLGLGLGLGGEQQSLGLEASLHCVIHGLLHLHMHTATPSPVISDAV